MKKTILILMSLVALFIFSGCAKPEMKTKDGVEYNLWPKENNSFKVSSQKLSLKQQLNIAAKETKLKGYPYFVLLNAGVNNLNGFPINNYKELVKYISLKKRKPSFQTNGQNQRRGSVPLIHGTSIRVLFKPVGKKVKNSYISVWPANQTLQDTK